MSRPLAVAAFVMAAVAGLALLVTGSGIASAGTGAAKSAAPGFTLTVTPSEKKLSELAPGFQYTAVLTRDPNAPSPLPSGAEVTGFDFYFNGFLGQHISANSEAPSPCATQEDGSLKCTLQIPVGASIHCGANTVDVSIDVITSDEQSTSITLASADMIADCRISVSPSIVSDQQPQPSHFTVATPDFPPCVNSGEVNPCEDGLTVDNKNLPAAANLNIAPDGSGATFDDSLGCGMHTVTLTEDNTGDHVSAQASATITVLCPRISLDQPEILASHPPAHVSVTGTQFHASQKFTITLGSNSATGTTDASEDPGRSGTFTAGGFNGVQVGTQGVHCGQNQVTASEQANGPGDHTFLQSANTQLQVAECIDVTPISVLVSPGQKLPDVFNQFTVSGTVPQANDLGAVTVTLNNVRECTAADHTVCTVQTDSDNHSFKETFAVPADPANPAKSAAACGGNTVDVRTSGEGSSTDVGSAVITVNCPDITLSPPEVGSQQLPTTFTVTPTGFPADGHVTQVTIDGSPQCGTGAQRPCNSPLTFAAPSGCKDPSQHPVEQHPVELTEEFGEGQTVSATEPFTLLCTNITLTPSAIVSTGRQATVTVVGSGFHALQPVTISAPGAQTRTIETGPGGGFSLPVNGVRPVGCGTFQVTAAELPVEGLVFPLSASKPLQVAGCVTAAPSPTLRTDLTKKGATFGVRGTDPTDAGGSVTVSFNGSQPGIAVPVDSTGNFTASNLPVPQADRRHPGQGPQCGAGNTVTVTAGANSVLAGKSIGSATITAYCPVITASPGIVGNNHPSASFTVNWQGFPPSGTPFTGTLVNVATGSSQVLTLRPDSGGAPQTLDFSASPGCGPDKLELARNFTNGAGSAETATAVTQITMLCPKITLTPSSIRPVGGQPVQVTGNQFDPGQKITITLGGSPVGTGLVGPDGTFRVQVKPPALSCKTYQVTAQELPGGPLAAPAGATPLGTEAPLQATAPLKVTGCAAVNGGGGKAAAKPTLAINPVVVEPGTLTEVTGSGFAPRQTVTLAWELPDGAPLPGGETVVADRDGSIDTWIMVMAHDQLGARQLVATQGKAKATANAVVDGGPMEPSHGDRLLYRR